MDAEGIRVVIIGCEHELVTAFAIDRAFALELCHVPGYHQPFVTRGLEVQVASFELELGVAVRDVGALLVLGTKPKVALPLRDGSSV
jgi:hypothetical protein